MVSARPPAPSHYRRRLPHRLGLALLPVLALAFAAPLSAQQDAGPGLEAFKTAWQRVTLGQADQPDSPALQHLAIYPYLVAARLRRDLAGPQPQQADAAVAAFLEAQAGNPVTRRLTTDWLRSLAQRQDWPALLKHYDPARADGALHCQWLQARIATDDGTGGTAALVQDIEKAYLTGHSRPQCDAAFGWLQAQGDLTPTLIEKRAQLALEDGNAGFALQLAAQLPDAQSQPLRQWAGLIENPEEALRALIAHPQQPVSGRALRDGWSRLARRDPDTALTLYPDLLRARQLVGRAARSYTRALALGLAWDRRPQAVHYFEGYTPGQDDDTALEWRVRAALWNGKWRLAAHWIEGMPPRLRDRPAWQYWLARSRAQLGDKASAQTIYRRLAATDGYYALLSAWRLREDYAPQPTPLVDNPELRARLASMPGVIRAHELFQADLSTDANVEWLIALAQATPDERLQGVRLAFGWKWYQQAVATASRQGVFEAYDLLYPLPYAAQVKTAAENSGLPENWIYGVMRQESLYRVDAVSSGDALGLMQLLLPTARDVARRQSLPRPSAADLFDPAVNLTLGAAYLRHLMDREDGRLVVALAGYNAGIRNAEHWLPDKPLPADIWIENIPYRETQNYVKRIVWHIAVFGWRRSSRPQSAADLLTPVAQPAGNG